MRRENSVLFALDDIRRLETNRRNDEASARVAAEAEAKAIAAAEAQRQRTEAELERVRVNLADARRAHAADTHAYSAAQRRVGELAAELVIAQHRAAAPLLRAAPPPSTRAPFGIALAVFGIGALAFFGGTRAGKTTFVPTIVSSPTVSAPPIAVAPAPVVAPPLPLAQAAPVVKRPRPTRRPETKPVVRARLELTDCERNPLCGIDLDDDKKR